MSIEDQPAPKATDRAPMWPAVVTFVRDNYENDDGETTVDKLVEDMTERDLVGRKRYGVPLTSGNGRNSLIDAYQELLDFAVYMRTELDERGIDPMSPETAGPTPLRKRKPNGEPLDLDDKENVMLAMFAASIEMLLQLRGMLA